MFNSLSSTRFTLSDQRAFAAARRVAAVAAEHSGEVDRHAEFPAAAVAALVEARLLAAVLPESQGGSTAMIWVMHQIMLDCAHRHGGPLDLVSRVVSDNRLLASVTSENGLGAELSRSNAVIEEGRRLEKDAMTVSYGQQAGAFLITSRRNRTSDDRDIVAVIVRSDQVRLHRTGTWNPMGMRGTCGHPFLIQAEFEPNQIIVDPFKTIKTDTLVPMSQILWSAVWIGLASEALDRAARALDARARRSSGAVSDHRMAWADQLLIGLETQLADAVGCFEEVRSGKRIADDRLAARLNALKLAASTITVTIAQHALSICGLAGYQEDGPLSIARILRDLYSAQVMVSNDRLLEANAASSVATRLLDT